MKARFVSPAITLLAAAASVLTMPPFGWWPLTFVTTGLIIVSVRGRSIRYSLWFGAVTGVVFYAAQTTWLNAYLGPVPWLALSVLEGLLFAVGMVGINLVWTLLDIDYDLPPRSRRIQVILGKPLAVLGLATVWVAREWLSGHVPYGGFQWSRLGQTQSASWLNKWAFWGGISGVSLATAIISATLVLLIGLQKTNSTSKLVFAAPAIVAILVPALTFINVAGQGSATIGAVQGNANAGLFANPVPGSILLKHVAATRLLAKDPASKNLDFAVWPENSSDLDPLSNAFAHQTVQNTVDNVIQKPLVLGAVTWRQNKLYNSTIQFEPNLGAVAIYDKRRPVPFAEYVPDRPFWYSLAPDLIGLIERGFEFGKGQGVFNVAGTRAGSLICFEIAIDEIPRDLVASGAQVILSQANNADFGHTAETFQQEALARLQAIATGRSVVHVSTVGVTEFIRPDGTVSAHLKPFTRGYLVKAVALSNTVTPAMRFFGWVDLISGASALGVCALYVLTFSKRKRYLQEVARLDEYAH